MAQEKVLASAAKKMALAKMLESLAMVKKMALAKVLVNAAVASAVHTRRDFLKAGFLSSAVFLMSGCELLGITTPKETIKLLQYDLFPKAKELGIDTTRYIDTIFLHSRISQREKDFLKNGVKWLNETAFESYNKRYTKLSKIEREKTLNTIAQTQWGENFLDSILRYTLEATLGDPIYGGNNKQAGWRWLGFAPPDPVAKKAYL